MGLRCSDRGTGRRVCPLGVFETRFAGNPKIEICVEPKVVGHDFFVDCGNDALRDVARSRGNLRVDNRNWVKGGTASFSANGLIVRLPEPHPKASTA